MNTKHKIEFSVSTTPGEHEKAWFMVQYRCGALQFWLLIFVSSLLLIGAAAYMLFNQQKEHIHWLAFVFCGIAVLLPFVYFSIVIPYVNKRRRYYLEKYMAIGKRDVTVFSHSISITSKLVSTDIPFHDCKFFIEKKEFFLLVRNRRGYLIIPKRDVPQGEIKELKKRLRQGSWVYRLFHRG